MTLALAFLGGLVSCLSPCVIPVIPVFVSNLTGGWMAGAFVWGGGVSATAPGTGTVQRRAS